jgi:hypothetical protein
VKVLIVATKSPWPAVDGGRVLLWNTLAALREAGVEASLVAPGPDREEERATATGALAEICEPYLIPAGSGPEGGSALRALRMPLTIARHSRRSVRRKVEELLDLGGYQVVHAEQLQALPQTAPASLRGIPVVLRAQNVESDLWREWGSQRGGVAGAALEAEGWRLANWEGRAARRASAVWALSPEDAARLSRLRGDGGPVEVVRPPYSALPEVDRSLEGSPAVVLMGSRGWRPNEDAILWFLEEVWPEVRAASPEALLHLYGDTEGLAPGGAGVRRYPAPEESWEAFPRGSIQAVPLRVGSGVRIKILEAWARGVPVVGTPQAFSGLGAEDGAEGLVAGTARDFAAALAALHSDPELRRRVVDGGRRKLLAQHSPARIGRQMAEAYASLLR